jgi:hypothetical protein
VERSNKESNVVFYWNPQHPRDAFLFYVADRPTDSIIEQIGEMIDRLENDRPWVIHPPYFVHQEEDVLDPETNLAVLTVGGLLEMYSAHEEWRHELPPEVDRAHYEECHYLVGRLAELSQRMDIEFHCEFQGEWVGTIKRGQLDDKLALQFLEPWATAVGCR